MAELQRTGESSFRCGTLGFSRPRRTRGRPAEGGPVLASTAAPIADLGRLAIVSFKPLVVREQYELALRWTEAKSRAGVIDPSLLGQAAHESSRQIISLAQFRLGRYSDALATLRQNDAPKLSHVAGALMSPWTSLTFH